MTDTAASSPPEKRIVVHIVQGRLAGLRRIVGHVVINDVADIPPAFRHTEHGDVQHAGTFPRYVLYRQFNPTQKGRFNDFHPEQR